MSATCQLYKLHKRRPYSESSNRRVCLCVCVYLCVCLCIYVSVRESERFNLISSQILDT